MQNRKLSVKMVTPKGEGWSKFKMAKNETNDFPTEAEAR